MCQEPRRRCPRLLCTASLQPRKQTAPGSERRFRDSVQAPQLPGPEGQSFYCNFFPDPRTLSHPCKTHPRFNKGFRGEGNSIQSLSTVRSTQMRPHGTCSFLPWPQRTAVGTPPWDPRQGRPRALRPQLCPFDLGDAGPRVPCRNSASPAFLQPGPCTSPKLSTQF